MKNTKDIKSSKATIIKLMLLSMFLVVSHVNIHAVYGLPDLSRLYRSLSSISFDDSFTYLCQNGYAETVRLILKYKPNFNTSYVNIRGNSPLVAAASQGHIEIVKLLLENNCYPDLADKNGHTPLHHAAIRGHCAIVENLIKKHADPRRVNMNWVISSECHKALQDAQKKTRWNTGCYDVGYEEYTDAMSIKAKERHQRRLACLRSSHHQRLFGNYDIRLADLQQNQVCQ